MLMIKFLVGLSVCTALYGAAPTIVDGPRVHVLQKNNFVAKWRTSEAPGATSTTASTLTASFGATSLTVASGDGGKFPAGSTIKIDHERMKVSVQSGDVLTIARGYDGEYTRVWEGQLTSVVSNGTTCTVNTSQTHYYVVGDSFQLVRIVPNGAISTSTTFVVATTPTTTSFTFSCAGSTAGTYSNAGLQVYQYPTSHSSGATITRYDSTGQVCYGTTSGVYTSSFAAISQVFGPQSVNHFVYVPALQPGTRYYWRAQSRTGQASGTTSCSSPDADTVQSSEQITDTPAAVAGDQVPTAPSTAGKTWDFTDTAMFTTDVLAASNCSDLQTKINTAAAADGSLNYRIRIPASANCLAQLTLPAKSGSNPTGTGKLVLESADYASLPTQGTRIDPVAYAAHMPTLYTTPSTAPVPPVITFAPSSSYWIVRGLRITADPTLASAAFLASGNGDFPLVTSFTGGSEDYDVNAQPNHIALEQLYVWSPDYNLYCKGPRLHGTYVAVMDSKVGPVFGSNDQGAVQIDGYASQYIYIYNNDLSGSMTGYYQSDNSLTPQDSIIAGNYLHKPRKWNNWSAEYQFGASQGVASATAGSTTTIVTTNQNDVSNVTPVAFSGATGSWTPINYTRWSVISGTMNVTVATGTATIVTSSAHGLTTGQYVSYGGGHIYPCTGFNANGTAAQITVTNSTTFTFTTGSADFSTSSGTQCPGSDIAVQGPVWYPTKVNETTFTITLNSTGFGSLSGTVIAGYPHIYTIKNAFEYKQGIRSLIQGNIIDGSWTQDQSGQLMVMSVRGLGTGGGWPMAQGTLCWSCNATISDIDIQQNWLMNGCSGLHILGSDDLSMVTPMYRVRAQGNLYHNVSPTAAGTGSCTNTPLAWNGTYSDLTIDHNTYFNDGKVISEDRTSAFPLSSKVYITNNIFDGSYAMDNNICEWSAMVTGNGCASPSFLDWSETRNIFYGDASARPTDPWSFSRQHMSGQTDGKSDGTDYTNSFWPVDHSGVGFVNAFTIDTATNAAPIVVHTTTAHGCAAGDVVRVMGATGNTNASGLWFVGAVTSQTIALAGSIGNGTFSGTASLVPWAGTCATVAGAALSGSSVYKAGTSFTAPGGPVSYIGAGQGQATDNTNIGFDAVALAAALNGTPVAPTITTSSPLPGGTVGISYSTILAASGTTPLTWSATGLPGWASLNTSTGAITGTPNAAAISTIAVTVTNTAGSDGPHNFFLTISAGASTPTGAVLVGPGSIVGAGRIQ